MPTHEPTFKSADNAKWIETLKGEHPRDIAEQIRDLPLTKMREVLRKLPDELTADAIVELPEEMQVQLFESMRLHRLSGIVSEMFSDDVADVLGQISTDRLRQIMSSLPHDEAKEISDLLEFPEDTAGGLMQTEFVAVDEGMTIGQAIEKLRDEEDYTSHGLFYIYVLDGQNRLKGVLKVRDLLFRKPETLIKDVMIEEVRALSVHADQEEIAILFRDYGYTALPVVDDFQRLRGVVTGDDVMHVMEEEATEDMQRMIGLSGEEEIDTPWKVSVSKRLPWLFINLGTAFLAGWVVSLFEDTITKYAVLAIFLPIIAGQGGNSGTQTLTILVRSIALGDVRISDQSKILIKEVLVALLNGLAIGIVVGVVSWLWQGNIVLGVVTFAAMVLNMIAAAIAGVLIPLGLKALKVDPALASAIMLTTVTDVVGFFLFLGFATLGFYYFPIGG